jgi:hypothetical protein
MRKTLGRSAEPQAEAWLKPAPRRAAPEAARANRYNQSAQPFLKPN